MNILDATLFNRLDLVEREMALDPDCAKKLADKFGRSALMLACLLLNVEMVALLIDASDLDKKDGGGRSCFDYAQAIKPGDESDSAGGHGGFYSEKQRKRVQVLAMLEARELELEMGLNPGAEKKRGGL